MSHIVWTTLPTRFVDGIYYASILVSPRIDGGTIAGTAFEDWPGTLAGASFSFLFQNGPEPVTMQARVRSAPFDGALWKELFPATTHVTPFQFEDYSLRPLWSYPVDVLMGGIDAMYTHVAQSSPTTKPLVGIAGPLQTALDGLHGANAKRIRFKEQYQAVRNGAPGFSWGGVAVAEQNKVATDPSLSAFERAAYLAKRFYSRPSTKARKDDKGNLLAHRPPPKRVFDFHEKLALLADHPFIMRKLGLVIDLEIPAQTMLTSGNVWASPTVTTGIDHVTPKTRFHVTGELFLPTAQSSSEATPQMLLPLDLADEYAAIQGDPDGDAQKVVDFASNIKNLFVQLNLEAQKTGRPAPGPREEGLPARRTSGFVVTRKNRQDKLKTRFGRANLVHNNIVAKAAPPPQQQQEVLYAEDLVRGYRVDVRTNTTPWASLQRRIVEYTLTSTDPATALYKTADEGTVNGAAGTSDPDPTVPDLYVHEALFGWEGWSLAAPRPGRVITNPKDGKPEQVTSPNTPPPADFPLKSTPRVEPGTLTPLRFGRQYAFRVRLVDLAGNSVRCDDPVLLRSTAQTALQTFKRVEPIAPPALVLKDVVTEGESVEHLVIRSGDDNNGTKMAPDAYASWLNQNYQDKKFPQKVYRPTSNRHVAPPKTTQIAAEQHGMFDGAFVLGVDRKIFFRRATREEGTFADKRIASLDVDNGYLDGNPNGATIVTPPQVPMDKRRAADGGPDTSSLTERRGDPLAPGEYVVCTADQVLLPYLPDPAARGMICWNADGGATLFAVSADGVWPDKTCFRLQLADGAMGAAFAGGVQQVSLPPATILRVRYASTPDETFLPHFAYWLDQSQAADVKTGRHWMLTPSRELVFVHAVQRPLEPAKANLKPSRNYDATFVNFAGTIGVHGNSTNHVDVVGSWNEFLDLPTRPMPNDVPGDAQRPTEAQSGFAFQVTAEYGKSSAVIPECRHELGDTKHRKITYKTVATTRYREYFPLELIAKPEMISLEGPALGPGDSSVISVPSSARPHAPKVAYVVPTFRWDGSLEGRTSIRRGNGLRVYLERPWYSSGEGEKLAVLVTKPGMYYGGTPEAVLEHASRWGRDPVYDSKANGPIVAGSFKNGTIVTGPKGAPTAGLRLADKDLRVHAAVFDVEFNAERKLWFADIELNEGTYFPFVRLALARYQAESLYDVELSPMVLAEFAQLVPDRTATFMPGKTDIRVTVSGAVAESYAAPYMESIPLLPARSITATAAPKTHRFIAYFQGRSVGAAEDMGWTDMGGETLLAGNFQATTGIGTWSATLPLPTTPAGMEIEVRLVVEEREYFVVDDTPTPFGYTARADYRIVYIDTFKIR